MIYKLFWFFLLPLNFSKIEEKQKKSKKDFASLKFSLLLKIYLNINYLKYLLSYPPFLLARKQSDVIFFFIIRESTHFSGQLHLFSFSSFDGILHIHIVGLCSYKDHLKHI